MKEKVNLVGTGWGLETDNEGRCTGIVNLTGRQGSDALVLAPKSLYSRKGAGQRFDIDLL